MGLWKKNTDIYKDIEEVNDYIRSGLKTNQKILHTAVNELACAGGKRLRPALVLLSGRFGKYDKTRLLPLSAAIEILHMATLVHDDIIDEAHLRRGVPTVQSRWGKDVAVFTGDFLFARAFSIISYKTSMENMQYLSKVINAICEGEIEQYQSRYKANIGIIQYLKRIGKKTALLFALSCRIGARESSCPRKMEWALYHFGFSLGMAFQITDDLMDFYGDEKQAGKPLENDFTQGIFTLPVVYAMGRQDYREKFAMLFKGDHITGEDMDKVREWVFESGGTAYASRLAERYLERARRYLQQLPPIDARGALEELTYELAARRN